MGGVTVCAGVEDLPNQNPDAAADVVLLGIDSKTPMAQKFLALGELKRQWSHVPVVVLSSCETLAERVQAVRFGAERYLVDSVAPEKTAGNFNGSDQPTRSGRVKGHGRVVVIYAWEICSQNCESPYAVARAYGQRRLGRVFKSSIWADGSIRQTNPRFAYPD